MRVANVSLLGTTFSEVYLSRHSVERIQEYKISFGYLFRALREGAFELSSQKVRKVHLRYKDLEIVFDEATRVIITVIVHTADRLFRKAPTLETVMPARLKEFVLKRVDQTSALNRDTRMNEYDFLMNIKRRKV